MSRSLPTLAVLSVLTVGCQAPARPTAAPSASAIRPVSTTLPAQPPVADTAAVTDRFTAAIWPALIDYHAHPAQNGTAQQYWLTVIDPQLDQPGWAALRQAVRDIGEVTPDGPNGVFAGVEGLHLVTNAISTATDTEATVAACYTYSMLTNTLESGEGPVATPAAAAADFTLVRADVWYLHAITNQRAVPGC